jgi:hypothetical protein
LRAKRAVARSLAVMVASSLVACARDHIVDRAAIKENENVVFDLTLVEVQGCWVGWDDVDKKTLALQNIPIPETLDVLTNTYGIKIKDTLARDVTVESEDDEGVLGSCKNPRFESVESPNNVSIAYRLVTGSFGGYSAQYEIEVRAGETVLFKDHAEVSPLKSSGLVTNMPEIWDGLIAHASEIDDALARHVKK